MSKRPAHTPSIELCEACDKAFCLDCDDYGHSEDGCYFCEECWHELLMEEVRQKAKKRNRKK